MCIEAHTGSKEDGVDQIVVRNTCPYQDTSSPFTAINHQSLRHFIILLASVDIAPMPIIVIGGTRAQKRSCIVGKQHTANIRKPVSEK